MRNPFRKGMVKAAYNAQKIWNIGRQSKIIFNGTPKNGATLSELLLNRSLSLSFNDVVGLNPVSSRIKLHDTH